MMVNRTKTITIATMMIALAIILAITMTLVLKERSQRDTSEGEKDGRSRASAVEEDLVKRIGRYTAGFAEERGYQPPTRAERKAAAEGVGLFLDGQRDQAQRRLASIGFEVRTVSDEVSGRSFAEIADRKEKSSARGWGRVYLALDAPIRWSIQVPHPVADKNTEQFGAQVLRGSPGGALVIAGAHRKAGEGDEADVAHRTDTVFDTVCDELTERGLPGVQVHGFADDSVPDHDVVASTGKGKVALAEGRVLADALKARGFAVCRGWVRDCPLEGRTNVQGRKAAADGISFLHIEFSNRLRTSEQRTARAVAAVNTVTANWAR